MAVIAKLQLESIVLSSKEVESTFISRAPGDLFAFVTCLSLVAPSGFLGTLKIRTHFVDENAEAQRGT